MAFNEKNIQESISLSSHTTFRIGGAARYFFEALTSEEIKDAILWAKEKRLPYFILGGGSNLLVSDKGFDGLVIKVKSLNFKIESEKIISDAGVPLALLVTKSLQNGLAGLEWAIGIPGTIGGAVCGNAGAYGHSISEIVFGGRAINSDGKIINFDKNACCFCYRGSAFKNSNGLAIVEVELKLTADKNGEAQAAMRNILADRHNKIPAFPSAGSFFKNIKLDEQSLNFKNIVPPEKIKKGMVPAAFLIEECGLKGKIQGRAQISDAHANFIVNFKNATADDVLVLAKLCKEKVKEKFGVVLEEETRYLGF